MHSAQFHPKQRGVRARCLSVGCGCHQYEHPSVGVLSTARAGTPWQKPVPAQVAAQPPAFSQVSTAAANWVLDLAAQVFAEYRMNGLSTSHVESLCKLGEKQGCVKCRQLLEYKTGQARWFSGFTGSRFWVGWLEHLTLAHVARSFQVAGDQLYNRSKELILEKLGKPEDFTGDLQKASQLSGWRTWKCEWDVRGKYFKLVPPVSGHYEPVVTDTLEARHNGDRDLALEHLKARATSWTLNERTLEVDRSRNNCTCGLYCWTTYELFCTENYRDFANISGNVIPFGTIQLGQDGKSLRASDMLITRMEVYFGKLSINGYGLPVKSSMMAGTWTDFLPQVDVVRESYNNVCKRLAEQFDLQVDLVMVDEKQDPHVVEDNKVILETFNGPSYRNAQATAQLPEWMRQGLQIGGEG